MLNGYLITGGILWLYTLSVINRAHLPAFYYWVGSIGAFLLGTFACHKYFVWFLSSLVSRGAGIIGQLTSSFIAYPFPAALDIKTVSGSITLLIDYECSGIIETMAYLSLLLFFPIYTRRQKIALSILGTLWIYLINVLRLCLSGIAVHYFNLQSLFLFHDIIGRIFFYIFTIFLYYQVFTHSQLMSQILGNSKLN
ncbi:exosortase family protein XrtG [Lactobacillus kalixensis]|uniref:Exosortase n=1 Tax=Lactobacillus kalixensis DSM 16043 TaxID=1423763 RepID=A0A0R1UBG7_9LACO|nr:exosortase family protein XrtG [Lactobacillus kalixensis]KRL90742.1 exosortase [Lactobacillus kalixensis DSM 16043]